jgi:hypothetical protein
LEVSCGCSDFNARSDKSNLKQPKTVISFVGTKKPASAEIGHLVQSIKSCIMQSDFAPMPRQSGLFRLNGGE